MIGRDDPTKRARTVLRATTLLASAVVATFLGIAAFQIAGPLLGATDTVTDMAGHQVSVDDDQKPTSEHVADSDVMTGSGTRLRVPSVDLNVPLDSLNAIGGEVIPPGFTSAYVVRNIGVPLQDAATGTVFVVMHSIRGDGVGPGDYLIDPAKHEATVRPGTAIEIGDQKYTVTSTHATLKTKLAMEASTWANVPNRLVLITCLQKASGTPSTENMVIMATRVTS